MDEKKISVMIVDDSLTLRTMFKKSLNDTEFDTVAEAGDGREAFEKYVEHRPELVVLDVMMPEVDGVTALTNIIAFDPQARVIMVSSRSSKDKLIESIERGAKNFIMKPFERDTLIQALKKAYEGQQSR